MTSNGRLRIAIITVTRKTAMYVLDNVAKMELNNGNVNIARTIGKLYTDNAVYEIFEKNKVQGLNADQVIVDYMAINPDILDRILIRSCVPYEYQVIDYFDVLGDE